MGTILIWTIKGKETTVIKTKKGYVRYNRWLYEQSYGTIPKGMLVRQKENTPLIVRSIDDLMLISRSENAAMNVRQLYNYPDSLKKAIKLKNRLIKILKNEHTK